MLTTKLKNSLIYQLMLEYDHLKYVLVRMYINKSQLTA
jgi:hypothetical protein